MGAFAGGSAAELPSLEEELAQVLMIHNILGQVLIIPYFGTGAMNNVCMYVTGAGFGMVSGHCWPKYDGILIHM